MQFIIDFFLHINLHRHHFEPGLLRLKHEESQVHNLDTADTLAEYSAHTTHTYLFTGMPPSFLHTAQV